LSRRVLARPLAPALLACACWLLACSGERGALLRGQGYYEDNQYERALSIWRELERNERALTPGDFARYAYLRGMTDYRLGYRPDARHWLSLAKVAEQEQPGGLDGAWLPRLDAALADLDRQSFGISSGNGDSVQSIEAPSFGPFQPPAPAPPPNQ
jgi:hypothetical protein